MRKKKEDNDWGIDDIFGQFAAGLTNVANKPNNLLYKPDPQQLPFHASQKKGRLYIGGNRSGKTTGGLNEDIWWLRGEHPYREVPKPPVIGRLVTVDFKNGLQKIILPGLRQWLPPSYLINGSWEDSWNGNNHVLTLENGSELEIMSDDQDLDKFAGVPRHFTHFDEEPRKDVFNECKMRLIDYNGSWWMTMTPVDGMDWSYEDIFEKSELGQNPLIDVIKASPHGNSHLDREAIENMMEGLDEDERKIRESGNYIALGGLIFSHYDAQRHVIESKVPPANWTHYISLDAGINNPTAVLWHAVSPDGLVVTYDEIYVTGRTIKQVADMIKEKERQYAQYGIIPFLRIADPAIKQRQQVTGLSTQIALSQEGLNFTTPKTRDVSAGLDKMNDYFRTNRWFITENCPNFQREAKVYRFDSYPTAKARERNNKKEQPLKKNDHACDSARYFFAFQPELNVEELEKKPLPTRDEVASLLGAGRIVVADYQIDRNLLKPQDEEIHFVTEVGEY